MSKPLLPHTYVLLFGMIAFVAILTWIVPSGTYQRQQVTTTMGVTANTVLPGTYSPVEKVSEQGDLRQGLFAVLRAPAEGVVHAADVIAFVLVLGGAFGIIMSTGAMDRGLKLLAVRFADKGILVIPVMMILLSLGGSTFGMSEEILALYPVVIALMFMLRFDSMTAVLILFLSTQAGYIGATINPFSVLLSQAIGGIQGNPLLWLRAVAWVCFTGLAVAYTMWYAARVRRNPEASPVHQSDLQLAEEHDLSEGFSFSRPDQLIVALFLLALCAVAWGVLTQGWYMGEIAAAFLACGILSGAAARMDPSDMAERFVEGCRDFIFAAFVIGLARGVLVVAQDGLIIDSLLHGMAILLDGLPTYLFTTVVLLVHNLVTFLIPSSSGGAALTTPVLVPLGDLVGVQRDVMVLAYQFGNGLTNLVSPTNGLLLAGLAMTRIPFSRWIRVIGPFFLVGWLLAAGFVALATSV